jgi:hypothetical protein
MDSNNTILNMEACLLQSRIKSWYFNSVGRDIALFNNANQEETIQTALRFTNTLISALELTGELINCTATIKFLFANTLRMIERRAKTITNDSTNFISYTRKRFTASLNLFRFLILPSYKESVQTDHLSSDALCVWGESLLCFAECSLKFWKPQCIHSQTPSRPLQYPVHKPLLNHKTPLKKKPPSTTPLQKNLQYDSSTIL